MVECLFGMEAMKVRFFLRAPLTHTFKYSIIDHLAIVQWIVHRASTSRMWVRFLLAGPDNSVFGEMDIIFVFETKVMGSIPVRPAR